MCHSCANFFSKQRGFQPTYHNVAYLDPDKSSSDTHIDDVIGISKIYSGIESLLFGNFSTPVININPASEIKVWPKRHFR